MVLSINSRSTDLELSHVFCCGMPSFRESSTWVTSGSGVQRVGDECQSTAWNWGKGARWWWNVGQARQQPIARRYSYPIRGAIHKRLAAGAEALRGGVRPAAERAAALVDQDRTARRAKRRRAG